MSDMIRQLASLDRVLPSFSKEKSPEYKRPSPKPPAPHYPPMMLPEPEPEPIYFPPSPAEQKLAAKKAEAARRQKLIQERALEQQARARAARRGY